jgi:hypothetical protein
MIQERDVSYQPTVPLTLREGNLHSLAINLNVLGDDGDELVFEGLQKLRRDLDPVVSQHQLQALFGDLPAGGLASSK